MRVEELIDELSRYEPSARVFIREDDPIWGSMDTDFIVSEENGDVIIEEL